MSARYERVRPNDDDDEHESPTSTSPAPPSQTNLNANSNPNTSVPNSPPPSFHSRASSQSRRNAANQGTSTVDPALADAFGNADDSDSESDGDPTVADDRRRLMRSRDALLPLRRPPTQQPQSAAPTSSSATGTPAASATSGRVYGGGIQSDGVFSNLVARPDVGEEKEELPPTYEQAAADAAPPYWETTILAPGLGGLDEVYVDGMPVGSVFSFIWNGMISMSFQVVGFLLTYLLHSTHAAKNGSRAGLGITLIQYGFYMQSTGDESTAPGGNNGMSAAGAAAAGGKATDGFASPPDPNAHSFDPGSVTSGGGGGGNGGDVDFSGNQYLAYIMMIVGWFVLIKAVSDYYRARRHEQLVLQSPDRGLGVPVIAEGESSEQVV